MWRPDQAIYGPAVPGPQPGFHQQRINMRPVTLEPTDKPVWPEDEVKEELEFQASGRNLPTLAPDAESRQTALGVHVGLPDRLHGYALKSLPGEAISLATHDYYLLSIPTSFSAPDNIIPRRLKLELILQDASGAKPPRIPVARRLHPATKVSTDITRLGTLKIDLAQALQQISPWLPDLLTAHTGGSLDLRRIRARVQADGRNSHVIRWRIADTKIAYDFNPSCVVEVPKAAQLTVNARLHVEVWKRTAIAFHKTYLIASRPTQYTLLNSVQVENLATGTEIILPRLSQERPREPRGAGDSTSIVKRDLPAPERLRTEPVLPTARIQQAERGNPAPAAPACGRGHPTTSFLQQVLVGEPGYCRECMAQMLGRCPSCGVRIRELLPWIGPDDAEGPGHYTPSALCDKCGYLFPWSTRQQRINHLENMIDREKLDGTTRLIVAHDLMLLRVYDDLDEDEQLELWRRIKNKAPDFVTGPAWRIIETLLTAYLIESLSIV